MDTGKSALGIDGNLAAALGYPIAILALISLIIEKENRFVRFHALQALLLFAAAIVVMIALWVIGAILVVAGIAASAATNSSALGSLVGVLLGVVWLVFSIAMIAAIILAAVKAYGGIEYKLPVIGNMAEKWTK